MVMLPLNPDDALRRERLQADIDAAHSKRPTLRRRDYGARRLALHDDLVAALETLLADAITAKMAEAGRLGYALTLTELEARFPNAFTNIAQARDVLRRAKEVGDAG